MHHLNFQRKKVCLSIFFPTENFFHAIFDFHFHKNPCFCNEFQTQVIHTPNYTLAIQSSALTVLAVRQQNICYSPALSTSRSGKESGQTISQWFTSSVVVCRTYSILPPSRRRLHFPSDKQEEEEPLYSGRTRTKEYTRDIYLINSVSTSSLQ